MNKLHLMFVFIFKQYTLLLHAEWVKDFKNKNGCLVHFYMRKPPTNLVEWENEEENNKFICQVPDQRLEDRSFYATVYNVKLRLPLYSAYIMTNDGRGASGIDDDNLWKIEPQLEQISRSKAMEEFEKSSLVRVDNQAVKSDYTQSGYDMGHLNPSSYQQPGAARTATYTMTNVAPFSPYVNRVDWRELQADSRKLIMNNCIKKREGIAYLITGVIPGGRNLKNGDTHKLINIPKAFYTAVCCQPGNGQRVGKFSFAYYIENNLGSKPEVLTIKALNKMVQRELRLDESDKKVEFFKFDCDNSGENEELKKLKDDLEKRKEKRKLQL